MKCQETCPAQRAVVLALVALVATTGNTAAQDRPWELGIDGAISHTVSEAEGTIASSTTQAWAFPLQRIRVGRWVAAPLQVQASSGFSVADFGDVSTVRFALGLAALYHISGSSYRSGLFVSLGTGFDLMNYYGTDIQWTGAGGVGWKVPLGRHFALRPAIEVARSFRSERRLAKTSITALFGVSVFTSAEEDER